MLLLQKYIRVSGISVITYFTCYLFYDALRQVSIFTMVSHTVYMWRHKYLQAVEDIEKEPSVFMVLLKDQTPYVHCFTEE